MAQKVKNLAAMQGTRVQSLDWEDPLEKGMATNSNILAWKIPWTVCIGTSLKQPEEGDPQRRPHLSALYVGCGRSLYRSSTRD